MTLTEETNLRLESRYREIMGLINGCSVLKLGKATKQKAKIELLKMVGVITVLITKAGPDCFVRLNGMLAASYSILADVCIVYLNEELIGQKYIMKSVKITEKFGEEPYLAYLKQSVLNIAGERLGVRDPQGAIYYLDEAENVYWKGRKFTPIEVEDMFVKTRELLPKTNLFEENYILTMSIRARIYINLKDNLKAAVFTHKALEVQLKCESLDYVQWISNAVFISKTFTANYGFKQARHLLAAAQYVLDKYELNVCPKKAAHERACMRTVLLTMWAAYGIELLRFSNEWVMSRGVGVIGEHITDLAQSELRKDTSATKDEIEGLIFMKLKIVAYEDQITDQIVVTTLEARRVFKTINSWLDELSFNKNPISNLYIRTVVYRSKAYAAVATFEQHYKIRTILHQKRIDFLEKLNGAMTQQSMMKRRPVWRELSKSYFDFVTEEHQMYHDQPTIAYAKKINSCIKKSMENFQNFINCYRNPKTKEYPEKIVDDHEEVDFLDSHVEMAFLYGKFIDSTDEELLRYDQERKNMLHVVVDYCERHPDAQRHLMLSTIKRKIIIMYLTMRKCQREDLLFE